MFSDKYDLTQLVIADRKIQTRRIIDIDPNFYSELFAIGDRAALFRNRKGTFKEVPFRYKKNEDVAIAESYFNLGYKQRNGYNERGFKNKMFVKACLMNNFIKILSVRVERLRDISDDDCIAEGICEDDFGFYFTENVHKIHYKTAREAFASLIDKINGKGTWEENYWTVVYEFEHLSLLDL